MTNEFSLVLRTDKDKNKDGEHQIHLRLYAQGKPTHLSTGIRVKAEFWDKATGKINGKKYPKGVEYNVILKRLLDQHNEALYSLKGKVEISSAQQIKAVIEGNLPKLFFEVAEVYQNDLKHRASINTYWSIGTALTKFKEFNKGMDIPLVNITPETISKFETYLRSVHKNKETTINKNVKWIRTVFNMAFKKGFIKYEENPFLKYQIRNVKTNRIALNFDDVNMFDAVSVNAGTLEELYKDMFLFQCYGFGLRASDLFRLKVANCDGKEIDIITTKTNEPIKYKLPIKAQKILNKYLTPGRTRSEYIFPRLCNKTKYTKESLAQTIKAETSLYNKYLKKIGKRASISKKMSSHIGRHTFACISLESGMPIEILGKLMGQLDLKSTRIYAKMTNQTINIMIDKYLNFEN